MLLIFTITIIVNPDLKQLILKCNQIIKWYQFCLAFLLSSDFIMPSACLDCIVMALLNMIMILEVIMEINLINSIIIDQNTSLETIILANATLKKIVYVLCETDWLQKSSKSFNIRLILKSFEILVFLSYVPWLNWKLR